MKQFNNLKHIHFVGIKGVGMTPLAIIAKEAGFTVSGCDIGEEFITDAALHTSGITPLVGFSKDHITQSDLVITTGAHGGFDNPEVMEAKKNNIPVWTQGQAVGEFMKGDIFQRKFEGISVTGSHGKTTTTAMLATVLKESKLDPSFVIGTGSVLSLDLPGHYGKGKQFVVEADEYATEPTYDKTEKFLWQHPKIAIFTNIEFDHPDLFPSVEAIRKAFLRFAQQLTPDGVLIAYNGDPQLHTLLKEYSGRVITFGYDKTSDFLLKKVSITSGQTFFWVETGNTTLGEFCLNVAGEHNALNATGVIVACLQLGLTIEEIKRCLLAYRGSKRRFEYVGKLASGALFYDDYAHHPTEIKKTLTAFKQNFPKHTIVCIFQPHTYSRTKYLFEEFSHSFNSADTVILSNIYSSLREEPDSTVSSQLLSEAVKRYHKDVVFLPGLPDVVKYINQKAYGKDTIVVTMGAGDIYKVAEELSFDKNT